MPVAKHAMQLLKIVQRGAGRGQHVAPVIPESVLLEFEVLACCRHELPHTRCFGAGHGLRVERAFNKRQQCQLGGHVAQLQFFNDVKQVFA